MQAFDDSRNLPSFLNNNNEPEPVSIFTNLKNKLSDPKPPQVKIRKVDLILIGDQGSGKLELANVLAKRQEDVKTTITVHYQQIKANKVLLAAGDSIKQAVGRPRKQLIVELTIKVVPTGLDKSAPRILSQFVGTYNDPAVNKDKTKDAVIFLLCTAINRQDSIRRINGYWLPQLIEPNLGDVPLIFVGTKSDLRTSPVVETDSETSPPINKHLVALEKGQALAKWIGAVGYVEFSSLTEAGLADLLEMIATAANLKRKDQRRRALKRVTSHHENTAFAHNCLKFVLVGDGACGKNCLARCFAEGKFPEEEYQATPFEQYQAVVHLVSVGNCHRVLDVPVTLWKTSGTNPNVGTIDFHNRLRGMSYPDSDAVLLCYAVDQLNAPRRVVEHWAEEIKSLCPNVPVILVGLKTDLRNDPKATEALGEAPISREVGEALAKQIGAVGYVECSSKYRDDVQEVFEEAVKAVFETERYQQNHCALM